MLTVRNATAADLPRLLEIYASARAFMIASGNPHQWGRSHPSPDLIASDISSGICRALCDATGIHGVFAYCAGIEPTYATIEGGEWLNDEPYVTIHRIASDGIVRGVFQAAFDYCRAACANVRIDTHADNLVMRRHIERAGFQKCGIIYLANGSPRIAYQYCSDEKAFPGCTHPPVQRSHPAGRPTG